MTTTSDGGATQAAMGRISPFVAVAPDSDFEDVRARMQGALVAAGGAWTDFNAPDPGTTAMEAAAFTIADVHYRIAAAGLESWPARWPGWLGEADRHWAGGLPAPSAAGSLGAVAATLKELLTVPGRDLEREVGDARDRTDAEALLARPPLSALASASLRPDVVSVLRWRRVRRVAMEYTDLIADTVDAADKASPDPAVADDAAAQELELLVALWPEECVALVRRERRRRLRESLVTELDHSAPESLEAALGVTKVWPPDSIQALTCEPVTAEDYATRARSHPQVRRAWSVRGRLPGIAWNGLPTPTQAQADAMPPTDVRRFLVPSPSAEAITIVVETAAAAPSDATLREILVHAVGSEATFPYNPWRDDLDTNEPRRLTCDEIGIAPLRIQQVRVSATLLIPPTANRTQVTSAAAATIDDFFETGRDAVPAPSLAAAAPLDGPWPPAPQPSAGWTPGESIRLSEVVARIVAIPEVIAVRELRMRREGSSTWAAGANGVLTIPVGHIPRRSVYDCFLTEFLLQGGCDA